MKFFMNSEKNAKTQVYNFLTEALLGKALESFLRQEEKKLPLLRVVGVFQRIRRELKGARAQSPNQRVLQWLFLVP